MWKKTEDQPQTQPSPLSTASSSPPARSGSIATLGPSIVIKGDLTGEEDLVIEGQVEGEIRLTKNSVTVGRNGRVRADIYGKRVHVEGEVRGNLYGETEVVIRASGKVHGNLVSPRVTLENGSKFKGSIDMEAARQDAAGSKASAGKDVRRDSQTVTRHEPAQKSLGGAIGKAVGEAGAQKPQDD